jgi:hypothetical protein
MPLRAQEDAMSEAVDRRRVKAMVVTLVILGVVPPIITVIGELLKEHLVWYIRMMDFLDLVVLAPLYFVLVFRLHRRSFRGGRQARPRSRRWRSYA